MRKFKNISQAPLTNFKRTSIHIPIPQLSGRMLFNPTFAIYFSVGRILLACDPKNGRELDETRDIVNFCNKNEQSIEEYFNTKSESINNDYRHDSNSAAASGIKAAELNKWLIDRDEMLIDLASQKKDVEDLSSGSSEAELPDNSSSHFPQDSSEVTETDFSSFLPFED